MKRSTSGAEGANVLGLGPLSLGLDLLNIEGRSLRSPRLRALAAVNSLGGCIWYLLDDVGSHLEYSLLSDLNL